MMLYVESSGSGPQLVLIHGWGLHSGVWHPILPKLRQQYRVTCVDLPGHGKSSASPALTSLRNLCTELHNTLILPAIFSGWSLGGLVATQFTLQYPEDVAQLALIATSPRFTETDHWQCALNAQLLRDFSTNLATHHQKTLNKFIALQVTGSECARDTLKILRKVQIDHTPDKLCLQAGLEVLEKMDLRIEFSKIHCPVRLLLGAQDKIVPHQVGSQIKKFLPSTKITTLSGAGHALLVSHPKETTKFLSSNDEP